MKRCARCGRKVKYPVRVGGKFYGSTCAKKVDESKVSFLEQEILNLRTQLAEIRSMILENKNVNMTTSLKVPKSKLPKVPGNGESSLVGMNYGSDHGALMDELRSVLKTRN